MTIDYDAVPSFAVVGETLEGEPIHRLPFHNSTTGQYGVLDYSIAPAHEATAGEIKIECLFEGLRARANLVDYLGTRGTPLEPRDFIATLVHDCRPNQPKIIPPNGNGAWIMNLWEYGEIAELVREEYGTAAPYAPLDPMLYFLVNHVVGGDATMTEVYLDWLAHIIQYPHRRTQVVMCLHGTQGTGKGILNNVIVAKLLGRKQRVKLDQSQLMSTFNSDVAVANVVVIDEVEVRPGTKDAENLERRVKDWSADSTIMSEEKYQRRQEMPNLINLVLQSNKQNMMIVEKGDRRCQIAERQQTPLINAGPMGEEWADMAQNHDDSPQLEELLKGFYCHLMNREVNLQKNVRMLVQTAARETLVDNSRTDTEELLKTLMDGDLASILAELRTGDALITSLGMGPSGFPNDKDSADEKDTKKLRRRMQQAVTSTVLTNEYGEQLHDVWIRDDLKLLVRVLLGKLMRPTAWRMAFAKVRPDWTPYQLKKLAFTNPNSATPAQVRGIPIVWHLSDHERAELSQFFANLDSASVIAPWAGDDSDGSE